jgi:predicted enzyme related to lactoylglutathione lyase
MNHTLTHFENPANNVEKLKRFYEEVFGCKIIQASGPIKYWVIQTVPLDPNSVLMRSGVNCGMYKKQVSESKPISYFELNP